MEYKVKGVKTFSGMEGRGFNASLYRDNKRVAFVIDDASGGSIMFEWLDREKPKVNIEVVDERGKKQSFEVTPEQKILYDYTKTLHPVESSYFPDGLPMDQDLFVGEIVGEYLEEKQLKRWCKNKIVTITRGCKKDEYVTFKVPYNEENKRVILEKNDDIIEIVNERFL